MLELMTNRCLNVQKEKNSSRESCKKSAFFCLHELNTWKHSHSNLKISIFLNQFFLRKVIRVAAP